MSKKAELIFMKWKAELADMDRSREAVEGNFELLFDQLSSSKVSMDAAMPYLDKAIKAHYPTDFVIKRTFQRMKKFGKSENMSDFEKSWKELISDTAKRVFFCFYEIDGVNKNASSTIGGMSRSEYVKLQRYADSHETIDWESIIRERDESVPDIDVSQVDVDIDLGDL